MLHCQKYPLPVQVLPRCGRSRIRSKGGYTVTTSHLLYHATTYFPQCGVLTRFNEHVTSFQIVCVHSTRRLLLLGERARSREREKGTGEIIKNIVEVESGTWPWPGNVSSLKELVIFLENLLWLFTVTNHKQGKVAQKGKSNQLVRAP